MSKNLPFKFNTQQQEYLIEQFALRTPIARIMQDFKILFPATPISGEALIDFKKVNAYKIKDVSDRILPDVKRCRLAHVTIRMQILDQIIEDAMTPKVIKSYKVSDTEWAQDMGIDSLAALKALHLAREEEYSAKKILLEKYKLDLVGEGGVRESGFSPVEVSDGIEEDDDDLPLLEDNE